MAKADTEVPLSDEAVELAIDMAQANVGFNFSADNLCKPVWLSKLLTWIIRLSTTTKDN